MAHPGLRVPVPRICRGCDRRQPGAVHLLAEAFVFAAPISTTQTITSAVMGVGATRRLSAVRWGDAGDIATAWVLTIPMAALVAAACCWLLHAIIGL